LPRFDIRGLGGDHRTIPSTSSSHIGRNTRERLSRLAICI
jgi:hypothetical protein